MNICHKILVASVVFIGWHIANSQQAVYPLHIGDRWQYTLAPITARIDQDSLMPNGQRYDLIHYGFGRFDRWERTAGCRVYWYNTERSQEYVWYDFCLSVGDTVSVIPQTNDSSVITFMGTGTRNVFGVMRTSWSFLIDYMPEAIDDEEYITVTDSLGMTSIASAWYTTEITGAIINGVRYGTIDTVGKLPDVQVSEFLLQQNYPNPFNPGTTIRYALPHTSFVTLTVYNTLGQQVAQLVNEQQQAGYHEATFRGEQLASGVYFYRLDAGPPERPYSASSGRAGSYTSVKKLLFLK